MTGNLIKAERLRAARIKAGYSSAAAAADAWGWKVAGYRHHENATRDFDSEAARKYARAFHVNPGYLLGIEAKREELANASGSSLSFIVRGPVAAGVWREPAEDFPLMEIEKPPSVAGERFGVVVEGFSMDLHYSPGDVLECISVFSREVEPESGDHVIVERIRSDGLRELTVKEFHKRDGKYYLKPKSTRPEFQAEILVGAPQEGFALDEEIRVIGFVVGTIPPAAQRVLERMGKLRRLV